MSEESRGRQCNARERADATGSFSYNVAKFLFWHKLHVLRALAAGGFRWGGCSESPLCPADRKFDHTLILHAQRMAGLTGRAAASLMQVEGPQWAVVRVVYAAVRPCSYCGTLTPHTLHLLPHTPMVSGARTHSGPSVQKCAEPGDGVGTPAAVAVAVQVAKFKA